MNRYSVSLVYQKYDYGLVTSKLLVVLVHANSKDEALGMGIQYFKEETQNWTLGMSGVIQITRRFFENK